MTAVRHVLDVAAVNVILRSPGGAVARDMLRRGLRVQAGAKQRVRANEGILRNSIHLASIVTDTGDLGVEIGSDLRYALYVHNGTGVYGQYGSPIVPTHGQFLVFTPRGSGRVVFARSVLGQEPNPFLKDALPLALG